MTRTGIRRSKLSMVVATVVVAISVFIAGIELFEELTTPHFHEPSFKHKDKNKITVPEKFGFAVLGDSNGEKGIYVKVLKEIEKDPDISFVVHLGDLTHRSGRDEYRDMGDLTASYLDKPLFIIPGNHDIYDNGPDTFGQIFGPPYYHVWAGKTKLLFLDASKVSRMDETQISWLEQRLAWRAKNGLILVFMHQPLYDPREKIDEPHCLSEAKAGRLLALFSKYNVDYVFTGHLHGFFAGKWGKVPFVISGGAGGEFQGQDPSHFFHHYLKVQVDGNKLNYSVVPIKAGENEAFLWHYFNYINMEKDEISLYLAIIVLSAILLFMEIRYRYRRAVDC